MSETRPTGKLREHRRAELVPAMSAEEYAAFVADIRERGLQTPLEITRRCTVLDGRHRLRAARELGLAKLPVRVVAPTDETAYMLAAALQRRHLSASQRAALALDLEEIRAATEQGRLRKLANLAQKPEVATLPLRRGRTRELAAELAGVSPRTVQHAATVRAADPALFEAIKAGRLPAHRAAMQLRRAENYAGIGSASPLPGDSFEVIYADPPWQLGNPHSAYAPENHYPTIGLEEIKALPVPAAEAAVLFLWAPCSVLRDAFEVVDAWGFEFRTTLVWVKDRIGLGRWVRHRHEHLLLARRGGFPLPVERARPDSVIEAPRGRHSQKPAVVYELIERMYPDASRLELFARSAQPGWTAWGNEVAA